MTAEWGVVACGADKRPGRWAAEELYTSPHFRLMLDCAVAAYGRDRTLILSAHYGLVTLDQELASYNVKLAAPGLDGKQWALADRINGQALKLGLAGRVNMLLPKAYAGAMRIGLAYHEAKWPGRNEHLKAIELVDRFASCRGIGDHRRVALELRRAAEVAAA